MSYQNRSLREIIEDNNTALVASIAAEISRAQTAEQANAAAILAEEARVDAILLNAPPLLDTFKEVVDAYEAADNSLAIITNNNTNNITANSTALAAEITRATAAESANTTSITNEVTRATSAESANATAIAAETTRATTAETANTAAINAEIARATAAEGANTTNLNTEITRAQTAEGLNTTNLNAEITRALAAESLNTTNLNAEITRATNAEIANAQNISNQGGTITALQQQQNINTTTIGGLFTQQGTNTTAIAQNTIAIGSNTTDIASNTTNIATNTTNIATNTTDIATNTTNIATNTTNIATNTTDIATNATAIATKQDTITGSTALTTGALTATATTNNIDLRNNLVAGAGVSLTQTGNNTTISNTATGSSVQYGWCASSTLSGTSTLSSGTILQFNTLTGHANRDFEAPAGATNYSTSGYYYEVAVAGYYQVGFNLYTISTEQTAITGVVKDVVGARGTYLIIGETGQETRSNEDFKVIAYFNLGDRIYVRSSTNIVLNWVNSATFFYGFLLQPENNTITSSTDLTTNSLTTSTTNVSNSNISNLTIDNNLNGQTFIRTVAIAKILGDGTNSKAVGCNVSRTAVGKYTFYFPAGSPRPDSQYVIQLTSAETSGLLDDVLIHVQDGTTFATGFNYYIHEQDNAGSPGTYRDRMHFVSIFDTD